MPFLAYGPGQRDASLRRADAVHGDLVQAGWPARHATMIGASTKYLVVGAAMGSFALDAYVTGLSAAYDDVVAKPRPRRRNAKQRTTTPVEQAAAKAAPRKGAAAAG